MQSGCVGWMTTKLRLAQDKTGGYTLHQGMSIVFYFNACCYSTHKIERAANLTALSKYLLPFQIQFIHDV